MIHLQLLCVVIFIWKLHSWLIKYNIMMMMCWFYLSHNGIGGVMVLFCVFNDLRWEAVVPFVYINRIVDNYNVFHERIGDLKKWSRNLTTELVQLCFIKRNGQRKYKYLVLGRDRSYFFLNPKKPLLILPKSLLKLISSTCSSFWLTTYSM
jgi:hypothetical protein